MKRKILTFLQFFSIGLLITTTNSCKKDDKKDDLVIKKNVLVTWSNPADIYAGIALSTTQLNATADVAGTFVYTPAIGTVLSLGANQNLKVDFIPTDAVHYNTATKTVTINVIKKIVTDIDGNDYPIVTIGTQTWMAENLKTTKYRNGDPIPNVTDSNQWLNLTSGAWAHYNNDSQFESPYGKLYNFYTIADPRKVCPVGWHVPTDSEWITLSAYLGGEFVAGDKLKEVGTTHWNGSNIGATNESGFTGLPGGIRSVDYGSFINISQNGYWWGNAEDGLNQWGCNLGEGSSQVYFGFSFAKEEGLSVRCLKD
jgi:uncharacterized protein (TIGR02145 family)